jgi:hypothetical protein
MDPEILLQMQSTQSGFRVEVQHPNLSLLPPAHPAGERQSGVVQKMRLNQDHLHGCERELWLLKQSALA